MPWIRAKQPKASDIERMSDNGEFGNSEVIPKFGEWLTEHADNAILKDAPKGAAKGLVDIFMSEFLDFSAWTREGTEKIRQELLKQLADYNKEFAARQASFRKSLEPLYKSLPKDIARRATYVSGDPDDVVEASVGGQVRYFRHGRELSGEESYVYQVDRSPFGL